MKLAAKCLSPDSCDQQLEIYLVYCENEGRYFAGDVGLPIQWKFFFVGGEGWWCQ
jgi:hypothetical protein